MEKRGETLPPQALSFVADALSAPPEALACVRLTKGGMTNRSFRLTCRGQEYILRVPGAGTDRLINRRQEAAVYAVLQGSGLCDHVLAFDPESGLKLSVFWTGARNCDPGRPEDVARCMALLRRFHGQALTVDHRFELVEKIKFYETLRGPKSVYSDYPAVRERMNGLIRFVQRQPKDQVLTHVDAVPDNFLFVPDEDGEALHLIDWEYAGMQDPHLDIAMFAVYAGYDRAGVDRLIDWYFDQGCAPAVRLKIYCYVAMSGLLWSNWCEYKASLGVEYGDYARRQYDYAVEFPRIFQEALRRLPEASA